MSLEIIPDDEREVTNRLNNSYYKMQFEISIYLPGCWAHLSTWNYLYGMCSYYFVFKIVSISVSNQSIYLLPRALVALKFLISKVKTKQIKSNQIFTYIMSLSDREEQLFFHLEYKKVQMCIHRKVNRWSLVSFNHVEHKLTS